MFTETQIEKMRIILYNLRRKTNCPSVIKDDFILFQNIMERETKLKHQIVKFFEGWSSQNLFKMAHVIANIKGYILQSYVCVNNMDLVRKQEAYIVAEQAVNIFNCYCARKGIDFVKLTESVLNVVIDSNLRESMTGEFDDKGNLSIFPDNIRPDQNKLIREVFELMEIQV